MNHLTEKHIRNAKRRAITAYNRGVRHYDNKHKTYNPAWFSDNILEHVSDMLGLFGVEAYQPGDDNPSYPKYSYVNAGDTYALTLIYNHHTRRFIIGCIGDIIEREE